MPRTVDATRPPPRAAAPLRRVARRDRRSGRRRVRWPGCGRCTVNGTCAGCACGAPRYTCERVRLLLPTCSSRHRQRLRAVGVEVDAVDVAVVGEDEHQRLCRLADELDRVALLQLDPVDPHRGRAVDLAAVDALVVVAAVRDAQVEAVRVVPEVVTAGRAGGEALRVRPAPSPPTARLVAGGRGRGRR